MGLIADIAMHTASLRLHDLTLPTRRHLPAPRRQTRMLAAYPVGAASCAALLTELGEPAA